MEIKLTDRIQLKEYFKKNKIPRESDFAEFIDASINQREDGIVKTPGDPLSIEAVGDVAGVQKLLNFYRKLSDAAPLWSLNASATKDDKVVAGLDITSGSGKSAIFIEEGTGRVGFGTLTPKAKFHVTEDIVVGNDADNQKFIIHTRSRVGGDFLHIAPDTGGSWNWNGGLIVKRDGTIGIGTIPSAGRLHVKGDVKVDGGDLNVAGNLTSSGNISFGANVRQMLNLWNANYGIGIQNWTMYYRSDKNFSWYVGGTHADDELTPGAGGETVMSLSRGSLKVGSPQVEGTIHILNKEQDANGSTLILGPTTSSNLRLGYNKTYSWIQSHGSKPLSINGIGNDVGIGISTPQAKLHVNGDIRVEGYVHVQQQIAFNAYLATNDQSGEKATLPLKNVSINYGNCFDISTSKFTAPVTGMYLFTMSMLCVTDNNVHWYLMHNGDHANAGGTNSDEKTERGLLSAYHKNLSVSRTVVLFMKKGDTVHVKQGGGGRCDNFRSGLAGVLLYAMAI